MLPLDAKCHGGDGEPLGAGGGGCSNPNQSRNFGAAVGSSKDQRDTQPWPLSHPHPNTLSAVLPGGPASPGWRLRASGPQWGTHRAGSCLPILRRRIPGEWPAGLPCCRERAGSSSSPVSCTKSRAARTQASTRHPFRAPILGAGMAAGWWPGGSGPQCLLPGDPGAYIARSLGPAPGSWATQGSVLPPKVATCVCSWGGAEAGKTPGGGRICGRLGAPDSQDPCPHSPPPLRSV